MKLIRKELIYPQMLILVKEVKRLIHEGDFETALLANEKVIRFFKKKKRTKINWKLWRWVYRIKGDL